MSHRSLSPAADGQSGPSKAPSWLSSTSCRGSILSCSTRRAPWQSSTYDAGDAVVLGRSARGARPDSEARAAMIAAELTRPLRGPLANSRTSPLDARPSFKLSSLIEPTRKWSVLAAFEF
jgi:hypothetical protein